MDSSDVAIAVTDGVIYHNGNVPTYSQKVTAAEGARRIKGVVDVVNELSAT